MIVNKPLPQVGEVVLVKIGRVMPYGAYCTLIEYNTNAYLPIAEVASGWIKNIHEFIKEGQRETAKVIFIDTAKKAIDVSLKKVNANERKVKVNEYNLETRSEQLLKQALTSIGKVQDFDKTKQKLATNFELYTDVVTIAYDKEDDLRALLGNELAHALHETAIKSIKPKIYEVSYRVELKALNNRGDVGSIRKALEEIEHLDVEVLYEGAPHYKLSAKGDTYPKAEEKIKSAEAVLGKYSGVIFYAVASKVK